MRYVFGKRTHLTLVRLRCCDSTQYQPRICRNFLKRTSSARGTSSRRAPAVRSSSNVTCRKDARAQLTMRKHFHRPRFEETSGATVRAERTAIRHAISWQGTFGHALVDHELASPTARLGRLKNPCESLFVNKEFDSQRNFERVLPLPNDSYENKAYAMRCLRILGLTHTPHHFPILKQQANCIFAFNMCMKS